VRRSRLVAATVILAVLLASRGTVADDHRGYRPYPLGYFVLLCYQEL